MSGNVNARKVLGRLRNSRYFKDARANHEETRVVVGASGCISHTWPFSRPHDLHSQFSVAVTHYILIAPHFTFPREMEARVELVCSGDRTGPPAHMSEHASERLTP